LFQGILSAMSTISKLSQKAEVLGKVERKPALYELPAAPLAENDFQHKQHRRMLVAAFLLLIALGVLLVRDWDLWFGPGDTDLAEIETTQAASIAAAPTNATHAPELPNGKIRKRVAGAASASAPDLSPIITDRKALPPLDVQVVAGGVQRVLRPNSDSIKVEMQAAPEPNPSPMLEFGEMSAPPTTNATQRVNMSADTTKALQTPVAPSYPVLARQMKVQGAVAIQALISAEGEIQDLRILSGPSILASAAQEAVRQWRFKPYLQSGRPVETQARITVNFTISTF
jgi:TonB family protein